MKKRKMTILTVILLMLFVTSSWAEKSKFQTYLTAGRSIIYSEDNPENISLINKKYYESATYGIILQFDKHLLDFNYKYFGNNPGALTGEISDEITGKEFWDFSLKYGRQLYSYANFDLNALAGVGFIKRKVNRYKAGPPRSTKAEFVTLPLKLTLSRAIYKRIGLNLSIFSDLNFEETIGGLEINLQVRIK